ncbi:MAG: hypothetical protein WD847_00495 [Pirellulales bacterium]
MVIPAYDLVLMFFTQAAVVVLSLLLLRRLRFRRLSSSEASGAAHPSRPSRASWPRFGLRQLFLAIVLAGGLFAIPAGVPKQQWAEWFADSWGEGPTLTKLGASLGAVTLAAAWAALGRRCTLVRVSLLCLVTVAVGVLWRIEDSILGLSNQGDGTESWWLAFIPAAAALTAAELALVRTWTLLPDRHGDRAPPPGGFRNRPAATRIARLGGAVGGAVILLPHAFIYYHLVTPTPIPPTRMPTPNAYDELVELGTEVGSTHIGDIDITAVDDLKRHIIGLPREDTGSDDLGRGHEPGDESLRRFVAQHQPLFDRARLALARESVVPVDFTLFGDNAENQLRLEDLGFAFAAEGTLAIHGNDARRAVRSYVNCIQLARATARGGALGDCWYADHIEMVGVRGLSILRHDLSPSQCRALVQTLAAADASRELLDDAFVHERAVWDHCLGWQGRLGRAAADMAGYSEDRASAETSQARVAAFLRLLICDLAIRSYRLERGNLPADLGQLAPDYLAALPEDPFSSAPLVYRREVEGYVLYSVGVNRRDDGGRPGENGDLLGKMRSSLGQWQTVSIGGIIMRGTIRCAFGEYAPERYQESKPE